MVIFQKILERLHTIQLPIIINFKSFQKHPPVAGTFIKDNPALKIFQTLFISLIFNEPMYN